MTDLPAIIAGLSPAMKSMIRHAAPYKSPVIQCWGNERTKRALRRRLLAAGDDCRLTPLGLAIKQALEHNQ